MINDNPPVSAIDKVFAVVTNRGRIMTIDDMCYKDPDIEYDSSNLLYYIHYISNGYITLSNDKAAKLDHFTQGDLEEGLVFFQHSGNEQGQAIVNVTDGIFSTVGHLSIQASSPYIRFINNSGLYVQNGHSVTITRYNFSIQSNLDMPDSTVHFDITVPPQHGSLVHLGQQDSRRFTMSDVAKENIIYQHNGSPQITDRFDFRVTMEDMRVEGFMKISILHTDEEDLHILNNLSVVTIEGGKSIITSSKVRVSLYIYFFFNSQT